MAIHDRLIFMNEAFGILDKFNGGSLKGSKTADNIFILKTLRVNTHILFYRLFKIGPARTRHQNPTQSISKDLFQIKRSGKA